MSVNVADKSAGIVSDISGDSENDPNALNISADSLVILSSKKSILAADPKVRQRKLHRKKRKRKRNCLRDVPLCITYN